VKSRSAVAFLLSTLAAAHGWALTKDVNYTQSAIQVSGEITQFPATSKLFDLSGQSSDNTAAFYGLWDDQALYFGVDVKDTALNCSTLPADSDVAWSNDGVELNFDLKNKKTLTPGDKDFRQWILLIVFNNNAYDAYGTGDMGDAAGFNGNAQVGVKLNGTPNDTAPDVGYTMIIRIPWTDLALAPGDNITFGFDGAVNDRDSLAATPTFMDWANLTVFAQPDKWNALRLTGKGAGPNPDGQVNPPTDGWQPPSDTIVSWTDGPGGQPVKRPQESMCDCDLGSAPRGGYWSSLALGLVVLSLIWRVRRGRQTPRSRD
jgi:hypothetical protein